MNHEEVARSLTAYKNREMNGHHVSLLHLGIDIGRAIASDADHNTDVISICESAQKIIDHIGIKERVDDNRSILFGLGYGFADRRAQKRQEKQEQEQEMQSMYFVDNGDCHGAQS